MGNIGNTMKKLLFVKLLLVIFSITLIACKPTVSEQQHHQASGYIEANYYYISSPQNGWLTSLRVKQGDLVSLEQPLFSLDNEQQQITLAQAEAELMQAQANLANLQKGARPLEIEQIEQQIEAQKAQVAFTYQEQQRWLAIADKDFSSKSQRDAAISNYQIAKAQLAQLQAQKSLAEQGARTDEINAAKAAVTVAEQKVANAQWLLSQRNVNAKNTGIVNDIYFRQGEYVPQGRPILLLVETDSTKVKFFVPQAQLSQLKLKQIVQITSDGQSTPVNAHISFISAEAEYTPPVIYAENVRDKLVFLVEAIVEDANAFTLGQPVDVSW
jgi:HlyD family secretion protein